MVDKIIECPYCGCKGHKKPHIIYREITDELIEHGHFSHICGSCGRPFRGYKREWENV